MHTRHLLSEADYSRLSELLYNRIPGLFPVVPALEALTTLLANCPRRPHNPELLSDRVGLGDKVLLVSPDDLSDVYEPSIVLPSEANLDKDLLSVLTPVGFAVIGRRVGDVVTWETAHGPRQMRIASVGKFETLLS